MGSFCSSSRGRVDVADDARLLADVRQLLRDMGTDPSRPGFPSSITDRKRDRDAIASRYLLKGADDVLFENLWELRGRMRGLGERLSSQHTVAFDRWEREVDFVFEYASFQQMLYGWIVRADDARLESDTARWLVRVDGLWMDARRLLMEFVSEQSVVLQ